ncbi:MAG: TAXI family TRAP transporter solute-binding subunit [Rhodospirillaceae bacterium]
MKQTLKIVAAAGVLALAAGPAAAQSLVMALDRAGTMFNASGSGVAKVVSQHSGHRLIVRAFGGPDSYMEALNEGKYDFSVISSSTAWYNYKGKNSANKEMANLRIIRSGGGALRLGFAVYEDGPIKKISDMKGRRVTSDFGGHAVIQPMVTASLAAFGLSWGDVTPVPVTGALDAPQALGADRADATWASLGMPVVREIHAKRKVRYLSFGDDPATLKAIQDATYPGVRMTQVKALPPLGVPEAAHLLTYDSYIVTHKDQDPAVIRDVLQALWDNTEELRKAHFSLGGFTQESAASDLPMLPHHPAAIAFYKEKGIWTDDIAREEEKLK